VPDANRSWGQSLASPVAAAIAVGAVVAMVQAEASAVIAAGLAAGLAVFAAVRFARAQESSPAAAARARTGLRALSATDVLAAMPEPALLFDRRGVAVHVNDAARRAFPGLEGGIVLKQWFRGLPLLDALEKTLAGTTFSQAAFSERRPVERAFRVDLALVRPAGEFGLMVFSDQTEALKVDRIRADFIANASHELRTPLTAVSGFLETLQGPARNDVVARERFIDLMLAQTQRMARLIEDLLSLSRLETNAAPEKIERLDLGRLAQSVAASLSTVTRDAGMEVTLDLPPDGPHVDGSPDELTQVIQNLIENACKYAASGQRIVVTAAGDGIREAGLTIRDFGDGIASEHIPRLTERFYRVDVQESRNRKGTGLGLAIVKHILTRHRGRLMIESRQGAGSAFTFLLPGV
jgi:two-component system, OmpR family, phosphate regulon sensor histidine kinase PhoR